eukprot:jgi/Phyca11/110264/e_gw1.18.56.1
MTEELRALEANGVWQVVKAPSGVRALHTKWVYKTKLDAGGGVERLKARLVACGNEQEFGVNYDVTFADVMGPSSVKIILALARKWRVPAKHGDVPNAYVKADKETELEIFVLSTRRRRPGCCRGVYGRLARDRKEARSCGCFFR